MASRLYKQLFYLEGLPWRQQLWTTQIQVNTVKKVAYILRIFFETVEEATRFQDQTINVFFQNSIKVFFFLELELSRDHSSKSSLAWETLSGYSKMEKYFSTKFKKNGNNPKCLKGKHHYHADRIGTKKNPTIAVFFFAFFIMLLENITQALFLLTAKHDIIRHSQVNLIWENTMRFSSPFSNFFQQLNTHMEEGILQIANMHRFQVRVSTSATNLELWRDLHFSNSKTGSVMPYNS